MKRLFLAIVIGTFLTACNSGTSDTSSHSQQKKPAKKKEKISRLVEQSKWPFNVRGADKITPLTDVEEMLRPNYWVVFDDSGSMESSVCSGSGDRIDAAIAATRKFYSLVPEEANFGLMTLNKGEVVPLSLKSQQGNVDGVIAAIRTGGGTPLRGATTDAINVMTTQGLKQGGYGEYNVIIITDGESGDGDIGGNVNYMVDKTTINVHAIGLCSDSNRALNQSGRTFYTSAGNTADLVKGFEAVLAETEDSFDDSTGGTF